MKLNWINTLPDGETTRKEFAFLPDKEGVENHVVNLYPEITFQTMEGFGGAITDAAGYVYSLMKEEQKHQLMETYFSPEQMKYGIVRIHMDSCDFSTEMYEAMSDPSDRELKTFSFSRTEKYILPMLADAENAAGKKLKLMLSPWSPPAFMKTNGERKHGGSLNRNIGSSGRITFAAIFWNSASVDMKSNGSHCRMSLKPCKPGTPAFTPPGRKKNFCVTSCTQHCKSMIFVMWRSLSGIITRSGSMSASGTPWTKQRRDMVAGVAFHWYSGDHFEALDLVRRQYPQLKMVVSEAALSIQIWCG